MMLVRFRPRVTKPPQAHRFFNSSNALRVPENMARKYGWNCIKTTVRLGSGEYRLRIDRSGVQLLLSGEPKAVSTDIQRDRFFEHLAQSRVSRDLGSEVRGMTGM